MSDVVLIRWPEEREDAQRLVRQGAALLYLVDGDADPPIPTSCLEDWVRIPGDDRDLSARLSALELRAAVHHAPPRVDEQGRLHYQGKILVLSAAEARLATTLATSFGTIVTDAALAAGASDGELRDPEPSLRAQMTELRLRLRHVDLYVRRIPRRGYILHAR